MPETKTGVYPVYVRRPGADWNRPPERVQCLERESRQGRHGYGARPCLGVGAGMMPV